MNKEAIRAARHIIVPGSGELSGWYEATMR